MIHMLEILMQVGVHTKKTLNNNQEAYNMDKILLLYGTNKEQEEARESLVEILHLKSIHAFTKKKKVFTVKNRENS